jgi:TfoX/Sxy family transcriptional regulator of competence genes
MAADDRLVERVRAALAAAGDVREVKMFGGSCFTLNGNMVAGASPRGLLLRVGKERHAEALSRPGAAPMEMRGRPLEGYIRIAPPPESEPALRNWLELAISYVRTLPPKRPKAAKRPDR